MGVVVGRESGRAGNLTIDVRAEYVPDVQAGDGRSMYRPALVKKWVAYIQAIG